MPLRFQDIKNDERSENNLAKLDLGQLKTGGLKNSRERNSTDYFSDRISGSDTKIYIRVSYTIV
jgi:hypothetical protein